MFGAVTVIVVLLLRYGAFAAVPAAPWWSGPCGAASCTVHGRGGADRCPTPGPAGWPRPSWAGPAGRRREGVPSPGTVGRVLTVGMAVSDAAPTERWRWAPSSSAWQRWWRCAQRRIGGFTGDVLGAAGVVGETLGLLALVAKW